MTWSVPSSVVDTIGLTIPLPPLSGGGGFGCGPTPITDYSGCTGSLPTNDAYLWSLPGISGGTYAIKVCYATVYLNTCYPYCRLSPQQFIQSLVLPNGTAWTFKYDSADPNNPNSIGWGDLTQLTFPTGGTISYGGWESVEMCGYLPAGRGLATRAIDAHDGTGPGTWSYSVVPPSIINSYPGPASFTRTVTDPQGNQTVVLLSQFGTRCQFYESRVQQYQSSATLLKTVTTDYSYESENDPQLATGYVMNVVPIRVTTSWEVAPPLVET